MACDDSECGDPPVGSSAVDTIKEGLTWASKKIKFSKRYCKKKELDQLKKKVKALEKQIKVMSEAKVTRIPNNNFWE